MPGSRELLRRASERFPVRAQVFVGQVVSPAVGPTVGGQAPGGPAKGLPGEDGAPESSGLSSSGSSGGRAGFGPTAWQTGAYLGSSIDLSLQGMLLRAARPLALDERLPLRILLPGRSTEVTAIGRVVRLDPTTYAPELGAALFFEQLSDEARQQIADLFAAAAAGRGFHYRIEPGEQDQGLLISLSGVLNATVDLTPLKQLRGELDFKLRDFRRISSDSIQSWLDFVRSLTGASRIRLHECPIAFVQQANAISNLLDNTQVVSFFAPYVCRGCHRDKEILLDVARDLTDAAGQLVRRPPPRRCDDCGQELAFDDIPERYFMFL